MVGLFVLSLLFSDLAPGETYLGRSLTAAITCLLGGVLFGYVNKERWYLAALTAWGAVLLGLVALTGALISGNLEEVAFLILPLASALLGGYLGAVARRINFRS